jgi:hypothetical protein
MEQIDDLFKVHFLRCRQSYSQVAAASSAGSLLATCE